MATKHLIIYKYKSGWGFWKEAGGVRREEQSRGGSRDIDVIEHYLFYILRPNYCCWPFIIHERKDKFNNILWCHGIPIQKGLARNLLYVLMLPINDDSVITSALQYV